MQLKEANRHVVTQRPSHAGYFERVRQSVVHEDAAGEGKHLSLVLESAEGSRKDETVVVALKFCTVVLALNVQMFLSEAFVGNELLPVHKKMKNEERLRQNRSIQRMECELF